jgi:multiple sugar transport system substrate-binding protein
MHFQDHAGEPVRQYLLNGSDERALLRELNELYVKSRKMA